MNSDEKYPFVPSTARLLRELRGDHAYMAKHAERERRRDARIEEFARLSKPILRELAAVGLSCSSIDGLRRSGVHYERAVPILIAWLPLITDPGLKEAVVRALSVPWARPVAAQPLIAEFLKAPGQGSGLKWAIGNALSVVADDSVFDNLAALVRDKRHGKAREMLAVAIGNMRDPRAVDLAIELLGDDEVAGHTLMAIGKLGAQKARPVVEPFLNHPKAWIRAKAKRVLARLDR